MAQLMSGGPQWIDTVTVYEYWLAHPINIFSKLWG